MAYSLQRAISDGTLNTIPVSIKYFDKTDISVFVNDVLLPNSTYTYVWSANNIVITPNVAKGSEVLIKRTTKFDTPYHDFSAGAVFKDSTVDDNFLQMLFIAQETSEGATQTDFYADLNFHGYRLRKVGNAIEPDDAVPFAQYRADALGAYQQRTLAEAARSNALAAQRASEAARDTSVSAANSAAASASTAAASASQAAASASTALGYRNEAETFKNAASASATNASNSATAAASSAAQAAAAASSINDANLVHKTGTETITGVKTFSVAPKIPVATAADEPIRKDTYDATFNQANTFSKAQRGAVVTLPCSTYVVADFALANNFNVYLTSHFGLGTPINVVAGQSGIIALTQDNYGSRTISFDPIWKFAGGTKPVLSTAPYAVDYLMYYVESTTRIFVTIVKDIK